MTAPDLEAIRARERAATPGPWRYSELAQRAPFYGGYCVTTDNEEDGAFLSERTRIEVDAAFISHAREDIPALLTYAEEQQRRAEKAEAERDKARRELNEERRYMLADEERRKLTGDALHAEGELAELRKAARASLDAEEDGLTTAQTALKALLAKGGA